MYRITLPSLCSELGGSALWGIYLGSFLGPFSFFVFAFPFDSAVVFLCTNTCVVHAPAAIVTQEKAHVLSLLEEVVDFGKLSAVQFVPRV